MTLSVAVTRSALSKADLELEDLGTGYAVVKLGRGSTTRRLDQATSPVVNGSVLVGVTEDMTTARLVIRCFGTVSEIETLMSDLEEAFGQWAYTIKVTLPGGTEETWVCQPANHARGDSGTYDPEALNAGWQDFVAEIPRQP